MSGKSDLEKAMLGGDIDYLLRIIDLPSNWVDEDIVDENGKVTGTYRKWVGNLELQKLAREMLDEFNDLED